MPKLLFVVDHMSVIQWPSSEVVPTARASNRKHYTTGQKDTLLDEYDKCLEWGSKGAFIRAAGITDSTLHSWPRQREAGELKSRSDTIKKRTRD